jgi:hypothetical protein
MSWCHPPREGPVIPPRSDTRANGGTMTTTTHIPTVTDMLNVFRRHRDHYLNQLAAEPLFQGVPQHLIAVLGRTVDVLLLPSRGSATCAPTRETIIIAEGHALLTDPDNRPIALTGPGAVIGHPSVNHTTTTQRLTAITPVRGFVIARRELHTLTTIAPRVADALTHLDTTRLDRAPHNRPALARNSRNSRPGNPSDFETAERRTPRRRRNLATAATNEP